MPTPLPYAEPPNNTEELCGRVRFRLDEPVQPSDAEREEYRASLDVMRAGRRTECVRVTARTMPDVARQVQAVTTRLMLTEEPEVFVQSDTTLNAHVLVASFERRPLVFLNSGLVQLLGTEELASIIGHEFGHAIFRHYRRSSEDGAQELFSRESARAREVSADRVGLIASPSLEVALHAEVRMATGLDDRHLRFDLESILADAEEGLAEARALGPGNPFRTHPEFAFRVWALARFATSEAYRPVQGTAGTRPHEDVEGEIEDEFLSLGDGIAFFRRSDYLHEALAWMGVLIVAHDDQVTREERNILVRLVGTLWADDAVEYARRHGLVAVRRQAEAALKPLAHMGIRARLRLEQAIVEFEAIAGASERCAEMVALIRTYGAH